MIDIPQITFKVTDRTPSLGWGISPRGKIMFRCQCGNWFRLDTMIWTCDRYTGKCEPSLHHKMSECGFHDHVRLIGYPELHSAQP